MYSIYACAKTLSILNGFVLNGVMKENLTSNHIIKAAISVAWN